LSILLTISLSLCVSVSALLRSSEPMTLCMLWKHCTTELHLQPCKCLYSWCYKICMLITMAFSSHYILQSIDNFYIIPGEKQWLTYYQIVKDGNRILIYFENDICTLLFLKYNFQFLSWVCITILDGIIF
jgi:hypothetical protein